MDAIQTLIPAALTELMRQAPLTQGKLEVAWRAAVGETLSRVTTPRLRAAGLVEVLVADQRWHREMRRSSPLILGRLQALLSKEAVTRLVISNEVRALGS